VPVHAGIAQVSRLTGDFARTLVSAPFGEMSCAPSAADATLTGRSRKT